MKKMNRKGFTLVELIIVIVVIGILAGMAAPKFMGVVRDARHANFVNDADVLTTVATLIETTREQDEPVYGNMGDVATNAVAFTAGADVVDALCESEYLAGGPYVDALNPTDAEMKAAADALKITPVDQIKYKANLGKNVKTGDLSNYYVITAGDQAGTIVYLVAETEEVAAETDFIGVLDGEGNESFGLDIVKAFVAE